MADKLLDSRNKRLRYFKKLHAAREILFSLAHYRTTSPQGEGVDNTLKFIMGDVVGLLSRTLYLKTREPY